MQATLDASYFDGSSARAHAVVLQLQGDVLLISGEGIERRVPLREVQWPERTRHGVRAAHFSGGGSVQCADSAAWDAWRRSSGHREPLVVTLQQSWRWVLASAVALVLLLGLLQQWGLPVAARAVVAVTPLSVDAALGEASLSVIDRHVMQPSQLPAAEQERLRNALTQALRSLPAGDVPAWQLVFRKSRIGPNAFALPGGTLVMTDELVELVGADPQVVVAVLAHELGHVRHRDSLRMLVQAAALSGLAGLVVGDFSTLLASVPVLLGQASYSRDAERAADHEAVRILTAARISPAVMVTLFERLQALHEKAAAKQDKPDKPDGQAGDGGQPAQDSWLGIAFASHPADAERVRYFREAAAQR